jgi:DNA-binding transcriptional regulator YdaS (Cro superfamily)
MTSTVWLCEEEEDMMTVHVRYFHDEPDMRRDAVRFFRAGTDGRREGAGPMARETRAKVGIPESSATLLALSQDALGLLGVDMARLLGISPRTLHRWYSKETGMAAQHLVTLARLVQPKDAALAVRLQAHAEYWYALIKASPPPPLPDLAPPPQPVATPPQPLPPPPPPVPLKLRVDGVVYAACEASEASAREVQRIVFAAFKRARELGVSVDEVEQELAPKAPKGRAK